MPRFYAVSFMMQVPSDWTRYKAAVAVEKALLSSREEKDTLLVQEVEEQDFHGKNEG
jgi:hypothetical protein